jgi:hypothetical protein
MRALTSLALMTAACVTVGVAPVAGQEGTPTKGFQPYLFAAPGGTSNGGTTLHVGGGADVLLWKGLGASVEGGYVGPMAAMNYGLGLISTNAFYQFGMPKPRRITPFVTGGYTLGFRSETVNAMNIGVGANYWMSDTLGLRFEMRDHLPVYDGAVRDDHLWGLRIGFTWRR